MKKKCGIITLHNVINYGAYLQAFALQTKLIQMGYDTEFVNLEESRIVSRFLQIKCKFPKRVIYNYRLLTEFDKVIPMLNVSGNKNQDYDTVIVGSDELWNINNGGFKHRREYLAYDLMAPNIISYAVSANKVTCDEFRHFYGGSVDFSQFTRISVRDKNTYDLVKSISGISPSIVCDPTLLLGNDWKKYAVRCKEKNFIMVYSFTVSEQEKKAIQRLAHSRGKQIISVGSYNPWCDQNICVTPFEFLGYMQAADYVVTSSFHGVVFSTLFNKKFVVHPQTKSKVLDLMKRLHIEELDATDLDDLLIILDKEIDYTKINDTVSCFAQQSMEWLRNAIEIDG